VRIFLDRADRAGSRDHDARRDVEAVELREELIQVLLPLVVATHDRADAPRLAHSIQLVAFS
jgi:electron transfer flavoprotein alpha/beta subunit